MSKDIINEAINVAEEYLKSKDEKTLSFNIGTWFNHLNKEQKQDTQLIAALAIMGPYDVNIDIEDADNLKNFFFKENKW